jgi:hypothetical protein
MVRAGTTARGRARIAALGLATAVVAADPPGPSIEIELTPREATVGDPLQLVVRVEVPPGTRLIAPDVGPELGPFAVLRGGWEPPAGPGDPRIWRGTLAAYRTGELELPPITVRVEGPEGARSTSSSALTVTVRSVLPDPTTTAETPELADLKGPASIPPNYTALRRAGTGLLLLLLLALVAWWLVRRYGERFAARPVPADPFHRVPPHVWVYEELQRLLNRRLAEDGRVDLFFAELATILKRYLGGRYRVQLMERTTSEVRPLLRQAGAPAEAAGAAEDLLGECDRVKFAREEPGPEACRAAVESAYRIVDATRPAEDLAGAA